MFGRENGREKKGKVRKIDHFYSLVVKGKRKFDGVVLFSWAPQFLYHLIWAEMVQRDRNIFLGPPLYILNDQYALNTFNKLQEF